MSKKIANYLGATINPVFRASTALTLLLSAAAVFQQAQAADAAPDATAPAAAPVTLAAADAAPGVKLESVIVTGTRTSGLKVEDSASPIQVLDATAIVGTGETDLVKALGNILPSAQVESFGSDTAALTTAIRLRGLSANDTLVLINGKRRHGTANLTVDTGSPFIGSAAADFSLIPSAAIGHVEALTDGAAAIYGTDAIAGVVNVILKRDDHGGTITTELGGYEDEGGRAGDVTGNFGFKPWTGAFANLTVEYRYHGYSNRGAVDPRVYPSYFNDPANKEPAAIDQAMLTLPNYPNLNRVLGDPSVRSELVFLNSGWDINDDLSAYSVASYGHKVGLAYENYRLPSKLTAVYPLGFDPSEGIDEKDYSLTLGLKGLVMGWNWDLSSTYGHDGNKIGTYNTVSPDLYNNLGSAQQNFQDGQFNGSQWTNTLDLTHDYDVGWASPLTVAVGAEERTDGFEIVAGEFSSRYLSGPSSYPGFNTTDAGSHSRSNEAIYLDVAGHPIKALSLDAAVRTEHFSDFGGTTVGKLTSRYDFTEQFGLRGTISTGFRAPTLLEEYYSATNVGPSTAFVQLPPNNAAARLLGINGLKPEKSDNLSFGVILRPDPATSMSLDAYQITIRDRIVGSGNVFGSYNGVLQSTAVNAAIAANGNVLDQAVLNSPIGQTGVNIFSNAANTRTRGAEFVASTLTRLQDLGRIDWSLSASWNKTTVTGVNQAPAQIAPQQLLDLTALSQLQTASPRWRANLEGVWHLSSWTFDVKEQYFGESSDYELGDDGNYYKDTLSAKTITSVSISDEVFKGFTVTAGANNVFNVYPDKKNPALQATYNAAGDNTAVLQYANFSPFGINGGFYYVRAAYAF